MVELAQMSNVGLLEVAHFLDGHLLGIECAQEHSALGARTQPLQARDVLERNLPVICGNRLQILVKL